MKNSVLRTQPEKVYEHIPSSDNLPLAIGANFHDDPINRSSLRKSHNVLLDRKVDFAPHTEYTYDGGRSAYKASAHGANKDEENEHLWEGWFSEEITKEDERDFVVRMLGFFTEKVPESPKESVRVRKVLVKFFTRDDSISITEAKQENSGIVQGKILARQQVPRRREDPDALISLGDFRIGESLTIYGRLYTILDMDKRSRRYLQEVHNVLVPEAVPWPEDLDTFNSTLKRQAQQTARRAMTLDDTDRKRAIEQQLTGIFTKHSNEDIAIARQFLKIPINEHLTFFALWDDRGNISGDLHYCVFRVFLENFTVEVAERRSDNCGRDGGNVLISRQRIARPGVDLSTSRFQQSTYGTLMKTDYMCPEDFQIGETYIFYGKPFFIYDCDGFTRTYMEDTYHISLRPAFDISSFVKDDQRPVLFYPPAPNGFGSECDRRTNWISLVGKPGKVNLEKARLEAGRIMNFTARLAKPLVPGDEKREFIITFHRETSELQIAEKALRGSGFMGGRFLVKERHRKQLPDGTTVLFEANDFVVGQEIVIHGRPFMLLGMDEGTRRIMEGTDKPLTEERIKQLVLLLKQQINLKFHSIRDAFLGLAPQGALGYIQIKEFFRSTSCDVSDEEAALVLQNLSPQCRGAISYEDFVRIMSVGVGSMDEASLTTRSIKNVNLTLDDDFIGTNALAVKKNRRRELKILLQQKLIQRCGSVQEQFRLCSNYSGTCRMNRDIFRRSLNDVMYFNVDKADEDALVSMMFDGIQDANGDITYKQFQQFVESSIDE